MFYSYVMGIGEEIRTLEESGFSAIPDGEHYTVTFPGEKADEWEAFITAHLEPGYWNEYLAKDRVVFIFNMEDGIRRYEVKNFENTEVLALCEKLCECEFGSIRSMLKGNWFYAEVLV